MILTYSLPRFKDAILAGTKIHTLREDPNRRWKPGMSIQHWMHNPRNASKNPHKFADGVCQGIQEIIIMRQSLTIPDVYLFLGDPENPATIDRHNGRFLTHEEVLELATNDGLTIEEFREWFVPATNPDYRVRIIHFTDKMY